MIFTGYDVTGFIFISGALKYRKGPQRATKTRKAPQSTAKELINLPKAHNLYNLAFLVG